MTTDLEKFLGSKVASAKFEDEAYGTIIGGEIVDEPEMMQQRDYETNDLLFYADGNPQMQMVIKVQTGLNESEHDDGVRAFYVRGAMRAAVIEALQRAGEKVPRKGGNLRVKYLRDEPVTLKNGKKGNPKKIYAAQYKPPVSRGAEAFFDQPAAQGGAPATSFDNGPQTALQASFATGGPVVSRRLACPEGVDPQRWAQMDAGQQQQMYTALGLGAPEAVAAAAGFNDEPPF
jgi:hypothetical protein